MRAWSEAIFFRLSWHVVLQMCWLLFWGITKPRISYNEGKKGRILWRRARGTCITSFKRSLTSYKGRQDANYSCVYEILNAMAQGLQSLVLWRVVSIRQTKWAPWTEFFWAWSSRSSITLEMRPSFKISMGTRKSFYIRAWIHDSPLLSFGLSWVLYSSHDLVGWHEERKA